MDSMTDVIRQCNHAAPNDESVLAPRYAVATLVAEFGASGGVRTDVPGLSSCSCPI